jgi:hypothetical protein
LKKQLHKLIFSLIVCTYVFSAVGVKIVAHYCGGELEKIALFSKPTSCCGGEEDSDMAEDDGCCQNDSKHVAFKSDFTFFTFVSDCKASVTDLFIIPNQQEYLSLTQIPLSVFLINKKDHPPNWVQDDIVSTSNLRI